MYRRSRPDTGNTKDKAIDFKFHFLAEGKWRPAVAIGIMDQHGTRVYPSQYLTASKYIYPFAFTVGFGNRRFGKQPLPSQGKEITIEMLSDNGPWRQDGQFLGALSLLLQNICP